MNRDTTCLKTVDENPNMLIPWYLMASYLYYIHDESLLSDEVYDEVCARLSYLFKTLTHVHKHKIDSGALKAGTAFHMKEEDYPTIVKSAAFRVFRGESL